jgi:hypothetical protein
MFPVALPSVVSRVARLFMTSSPTVPVSCTLRHGDVLRLDRGPATRRTLLVTHGTVWLTTTPADGDTILRAGDRVELTGGWPVVAQAIGDDAELDVTPAPC